MSTHPSHLRLVHSVPRSAPESPSEPSGTDPMGEPIDDHPEAPRLRPWSVDLALCGWVAACLPFVFISTFGFTGMLVLFILFS